MKVMEKDTDRRAEAHIYIDGRVKELEEYGEYIDPDDKAICCYVPIEEGHRVKIRARFWGTTLTVACDAVVDGVYRKASSYTAKMVHNLKNKRIDTDTFLYKTQKGIIDTEIHVVPLTGVILSRGDGPESIGTMELRLYITRQIGVHHVPSNIEKYSSHKGDTEKEMDETATYKQVEPTFRMAFEKNCAPSEKQKCGSEQRRMETSRPGTEPWAIFRFHYRSKEAIVEHHLPLTLDPNNRSRYQPHALALEPVPALPLGINSQKDDGDSSTRASTPRGRETSSTPLQDAKKRPTAKSPTLPKRQRTKPDSTLTPVTTSNMISTTEKGIMPSSENTPAPGSHASVTEDLCAPVLSKPPPNSTSLEVYNTTGQRASTNADGDSVTSTSLVSSDIGNMSKSHKDTNDKGFDLPTKTPAEKESATIGDTIAVTLLKDNCIGSIGDGNAQPSTQPKPNFKFIHGAATKITTPAMTPATKAPQVVIPLAKKSAGKPSANTITSVTTQKTPAAVAPPVISMKRTAEPRIVNLPEIKRIKPIPPPAEPMVPTIMPCVPPGTISPRPMSIERKVAEQRKKLEALRQKRLETAKKQESLDKQMVPYRKRMVEELERLSREMTEEEAAAVEDEEHLKASVEMLAEFEKAGGGN